MTISNGYCSLTELQTSLWPEGYTGGSGSDAEMEQVIEAVSRQFDKYCGRRFYAASETRYYTAYETDNVDIDDLVSITTLETDNDQDRTYSLGWGPTQYDLLPFNAAIEGQYMPYQSIWITPSGSCAFPLVKKGVKITGIHGWPKDASSSGSAQAPEVVKRAAVIQASRIYKRRDSPFGIVGNPEFGVQNIPSMDPDVERLLEPFVKLQIP